MTEGASVIEHLNRLNTIVNQLISVEIQFDDEMRALALLAALPNCWESMKAATSNPLGSAKLKFVEIRDADLAEEIPRKDCEGFFIWFCFEY